MEPVEVTARFDSQGKITPLDFTLKGQTYPVLSTGRRWQHETSQHMLVIVPGERIYKLVFVLSEVRWYLSRPGAERECA